MNILILVTISITCIVFLIFPFIKKSDIRDENVQVYSDLRRKKILLELTSELENGTITKTQFSEMKKELFKMESTKSNLPNEGIDPIEKIIKIKKNQNA